jgi:hypothetical protein
LYFASIYLRAGSGRGPDRDSCASRHTRLCAEKDTLSHFLGGWLFACLTVEPTIDAVHVALSPRVETLTLSLSPAYEVATDTDPAETEGKAHDHSINIEPTMPSNGALLFFWVPPRTGRLSSLALRSARDAAPPSDRQSSRAYFALILSMLPAHVQN